MQKVALTLVVVGALILSGWEAWEYVWPRFSERCSLRIDLRQAGVDLIPLAGVEVENPTRVAVGPSGELWVAERFGKIHILRVRAGLAGFRVESEELIDSIQAITNHNDDGEIRPDLGERLITGLTVVESSGETVAYVASSDPRIDNGDIDTNSGVISRLRKIDGAWVREDVVRGLPRSKSDHAVNAIAVSEDRNKLYVLQGANTNAGAPSDMFYGVPEYALSGALLEVYLEELEIPYDLPTLDDEGRDGDPDANDPFGGASGNNQAILDPDGPVRIYTAGLRNPYAITSTEAGFYVADNGANQNYGGEPEIDERGLPTNAPREGGPDRPDHLYLVDRAGLRFGHPNPTRSNPNSLFNASNRQRPVPAVAIEDSSANAEPLLSWETSTNGLAWVAEWPGQISENGFLISIDLKGVVEMHVLGADGRVERSEIALRSHRMLLDAAASDPLGGSLGMIWTVDHGQGQVLALDRAASGRGTIWRAARSLPRIALETGCSLAGLEMR